MMIETKEDLLKGLRVWLSAIPDKFMIRDAHGREEECSDWCKGYYQGLKQGVKSCIEIIEQCPFD